MVSVSWCDRVIRWGYYLLFALVPLLLTPWNYELFEFNKMMAVYVLTVVVTGAWLIKSIAQKELRIARTPLDIPIALFVTSQLVSSLFSMDPHVSWFGYYSRFNGGMLSIMSYVLLYYAYVSNLQPTTYPSTSSGSRAESRDNLQLLKVALATGGIVALYGVAERLGIDKHLWVQDVQNRVFSTLGQPNWLAAYLVALIPLAAGFGLKAQMSKLKVQNNIKAQNPKQFGNLDFGFGLSLGFWIWSFIASLFFLVLLFTRSRSGLLGFVVADVVFWGLLHLYTYKGRSHPEKVSPFQANFVKFIILHAVFLLIIFFNGTSITFIDRWLTLEGWKSRLSQPTTNNLQPTTAEATASAYTAPLLETGGTKSGTIRKYVWQGAVNAWRSSPKTYLIGTGTETFAFAFYQNRPRQHNLTSEWDFLYNKAHNEYLNYLATTGIFGLGSYLFFIGSFVVWFFWRCCHFGLDPESSSKSRMDSRLRGNDKEGSGNDTIIHVALFSAWLSILVTNFFGFSVVIVQVFLFLFPVMAIAEERVQARKLNVSRDFFVPLVILVSLVLLVLLSLGWYADTLYAVGYRASRAGQYDVAVDQLSRARALNPVEPVYSDELGMAYAGLVTMAIEEKDATKAADFVKRSLASSDRALITSPKNVNFWKTRTKIYYSFSSFDPAFNDASITALENALGLSPNDPKITYNLAILYGRKGMNDKAIDILKTSIGLKSNYRDAYYALWVFYMETKKSDLAQKVLEDYLSNVDPGDKDFLERLNQ